MANNKPFKIKNGLSAKVYLQSSSALGASDVDVSAGSYFSKTLTADTTLTFSNPPASGLAGSFALEITGANVTVGYDIANAAYDSVSFYTGTFFTQLRGLTFKPDGTKMYATGSLNRVQQYSLSTAWDASTISYDSQFYVSTEDTGVYDIALNNNGTKMYILGDTNNSIFQYTLSTAYDLSTASYDSVSFSVGTQEGTPKSLVFKPDGTKMYIYGTTARTIFQYSLSTAYDISTASYNSVSFAVSTSYHIYPAGLAFNNDGTKMFTMGYTYDAIRQWSLSTAWDVSTASHDSIGFYLGSQGGSMFAMSFSSDGTKLYTVDFANDTLFQYSTSGLVATTVTYPSSVKWHSDTTPYSPAPGEKDLYVFVTADGGTNYYGKQAGDALS